MPQEEIDRLLVEHGRAGRRVVRLKGGDPLVFGRGGEEALVLREAGVEFEIVPGVTAGVAAPAYAGIPVDAPRARQRRRLRHRPRGPDKPESVLDWAALARFPGTLVFYMGVRALPRIAERLRAGAAPADEPVAVIERGTLPGQRTLLGTLADVAERAAAERIRAPAVTLVGPVAALRERAGVARARARCTAARRRHARPRPGQPARRPPARPRRDGDRGARDPHRPARRPRCPTSAALRPGRVTLAQRRPRAVRAPAATPAATPAPRRPPGRRDGARHRARVRASTGSCPTSCRRARWPRASSRRWPDVAARRARSSCARARAATC